LRLAAELDNQRKRAAREAESARQFGIERFAGDLLDVVDSLEMGLAAAGASAEALREGSEATLRQLNSAFEKHGVSVVDPVGEPFDPQRHEALTTQPSQHAEPGSILSVVQKGYLLNGRLLRPARVIVAAEVPDTGGDQA
jgi:molecular chaperone GrpE